MNNTVAQNNRQRGHRSHRHNAPSFFAPSFGNIINEILNSPLNEVVAEHPKKYTYPAANIIKAEDGSYHLALSIPGVAKEDVKINIEDHKLTIKSDVEENTETKYRLREFNYAKFERVFTLSEDADIDNISANFESGILNIHIPTVEKAGPKKVEIA